MRESAQAVPAASGSASRSRAAVVTAIAIGWLVVVDLGLAAVAAATASAWRDTGNATLAWIAGALALNLAAVATIVAVRRLARPARSAGRSPVDPQAWPDRQLLELFAENTPATVYLKDLDGRYRMVNRRFLEMFGLRADEVLGRTDAQLFPAATARAFRAGDELVLRDDAAHDLEEGVALADGSVRIYISVKFPLRDAGGRTFAVGGVSTDITDRKLAEQALAEARAVAEAATRAKSAFLANVSHEIRSPMNAVIGLTDLVLRTELDERQRLYLERTHVAGRSLLKIVNDTLDFSKIEAGHLEVEAHEFAWREVREPLVAIVGHAAQVKGLAFELDRAPDVPERVVGDAARLTQVLVNLCGNAVKFTEQGRVRVALRREAVAGGRVGVRFSVRDTGIGMSPSQVAQLFRPFSQVDASSERRRRGTGLGLAISEQLVRLMGGDGIHVDSAPGRGTEFSFVLALAPGRETPLASAPSAQTAPAGEVAVARLRGLRVLLVEDDEINQLVAESLLAGMAGVDLVVAGDGQAALDLLQESRFDIVLTDIEMPVMDGYETVRRLRARPGLAALPVIAMTGHAGEQERERCLASGMNDFVTKPFDPGELFAVVARWAPAAAHAA